MTTQVRLDNLTAEQADRLQTAVQAGMLDALGRATASVKGVKPPEQSHALDASPEQSRGSSEACLTTPDRPEPVDTPAFPRLGGLRQLVVTVSESEVIITGRVPTYYLKQMAEQTVQSVVEKKKIRSRIEVREDSASK